jgi:hypothetical protein
MGCKWIENGISQVHEKARNLVPHKRQASRKPRRNFQRKHVTSKRSITNFNYSLKGGSMRAIRSVITCACLAAALSACVQAPTRQGDSANQLTAGQVSLTLRKNQTTQTEVLETFGAPNLVTQNADGEEAWTYQKHATVANASSQSGFATIILAGVQSSSSGFEQSSRTMTLIIKFKDINGVKTVVDFTSRSTSF